MAATVPEAINRLGAALIPEHDLEAYPVAINDPATWADACWYISRYTPVDGHGVFEWARLSIDLEIFAEHVGRQLVESAERIDRAIEQLATALGPVFAHFGTVARELQALAERLEAQRRAIATIRTPYRARRRLPDRSPVRPWAELRDRSFHRSGMYWMFPIRAP